MSNLYSQNEKPNKKNSGNPTGSLSYSFGNNVQNVVDNSLNQHVQNFNQHSHQNKSLLGRKQYNKVHHNSPFGMTQDVINNSHNNPLATHHSNCNNSSHPHNSVRNNYQSFHPNNIQSHMSKKTTTGDKKKDCQDSSAHTCTLRKNLSMHCSWMDAHDPPFCPLHKVGHKIKQSYQHSTGSERSLGRRRSERSESNNSSRISGTGTENSSRKDQRRAKRKREVSKSKKKRRLQKQKADGRENAGSQRGMNSIRRRMREVPGGFLSYVAIPYENKSIKHNPGQPMTFPNIVPRFHQVDSSRRAFQDGTEQIVIHIPQNVCVNPAKIKDNGDNIEMGYDENSMGGVSSEKNVPYYSNGIVQKPKINARSSNEFILPERHFQSRHVNEKIYEISDGTNGGNMARNRTNLNEDTEINNLFNSRNSEQIHSNGVYSNQVQAGQIHAGQAHASQYQVGGMNQIQQAHMYSNQIISEQVNSNQIGSHQMAQQNSGDHIFQHQIESYPSISNFPLAQVSPNQNQIKDAPSTCTTKLQLTPLQFVRNQVSPDVYSQNPSGSRNDSNQDQNQHILEEVNSNFHSNSNSTNLPTNQFKPSNQPVQNSRLEIHDTTNSSDSNNIKCVDSENSKNSNSKSSSGNQINEGQSSLRKEVIKDTNLPGNTQSSHAGVTLYDMFKDEWALHDETTKTKMVAMAKTYSRTTTDIRRLDEKEAYKNLGSLVAMLPSAEDEDTATHTQATLLFLAAQRITSVNALRAKRHAEITSLREKIKDLNSDLRAQIHNRDNEESSPSGSGSSETADSNDNSQTGTNGPKIQTKSLARIFNQPKTENAKANIGEFLESRMRKNWRYYYFGRLFLRPILGSYWTVTNFKNQNTQLSTLKQWRRMSFKRTEMHQHAQKELIAVVNENEFIAFQDLTTENEAEENAVKENLEDHKMKIESKAPTKKKRINELEIFTRTCDIVADFFDK